LSTVGLLRFTGRESNLADMFRLGNLTTIVRATEKLS
jgi:hypothetical protein